MNSITTNISSDPKITFLIQSDTVNIENYTIKDIPGSSGRLDVVARCILAALLNQDGFDEHIQIIVFFKRYGAYSFNTADLDYAIFPKDELQLSDALYHLIRNRNNREYLQNNPMDPIKIFDNSMIHYIQELQKEKGHGIFVLKESEETFKNSLNCLLETKEIKDFIFIIGNQSEDFINSDEFLRLNLPEVSLGSQSYLASSVIRLIKIYLRKLDL